MIGIEIKEWNQVRAQEYVNALRLTVSLIDEREWTIAELRAVLVECIERELIN